MNIESHAMALSKILTLDDDVQFRIPDYQRHYSWKPEHIDQLFDDILNEEKGYYIGNLLVTKSEGSARNNTYAYDVIDGQQRLTTVSLFLLAIWEQAKEWYDDGTPIQTLAKIGGLQSDIKRRLLIDEDINNPRLRLLDDDSEIYSKLLQVLDENNEDLPKAPRNRTFTKRYAYIRSLFQDDKKHNFPTFETLKDFYDKLISITLLQIEVGNIGDAFTVFSSLNSTGLPLTLVDLLKGRFIESACNTYQEDKNTVLEKWSTFIDLFTQSDNDANITVTTQFLLNNYDAFENKSNTSITKGKALKQYREIIQQKYRDNVDYLQEITDHGKVFAQILQLQSHPDERINQRLASLSRLESTQAYPLMLFLLVEQDNLQLSNEQIDSILDVLVIFYVRRNIALIPKSSNIRARMLQIIHKIHFDSLRGKSIVNEVIKELQRISVNDEQFSTAITSEGMYDKSSNTTRFVLITIERYLNCVSNTSIFDKGHPDNLDEYMPKNGKPYWSIEHILPEGKLPSHWATMISPDDPDKAEDIAEQNKHLIGNLTLTPYNANLAQKPFVNENHPYIKGNTYTDSKRDFTDNGHFVGLRQRLSINASIADTEHGETIESKTQWTIDDIKRRTNWFKDIMLQVFAFPEVDE